MDAESKRMTKTTEKTTENTKVERRHTVAYYSIHGNNGVILAVDFCIRFLRRLVSVQLLKHLRRPSVFVSGRKVHDRGGVVGEKLQRGERFVTRNEKHRRHSS